MCTGADHYFRPSKPHSGKLCALPDDPGAVDWHAVLRGVAHVLLRDVGGPDVVRGAADLKLTLGDEWNAFERIWNEIVNSPESIVLNRAVRHEPERQTERKG